MVNLCERSADLASKHGRPGGGMSRRGLAVKWSVLAGVGLALLAGEAWVRSISWFQYSWDPDLGEVHSPGSRFVLWSEGSGSGRFSAYGARASGPGEPADGDSIRVLVIGDSFAEALQVNDEQLFSNRLARSPGVHELGLTVSNAGRAASSVADYACRAAAFRKLFSPRWVVVLLNEGDFDEDAFSERVGFARFLRRSGPLECVGPTLPPPPPRRGPIRAVAHELRSRFSLPDTLLSRLKARIEADATSSPVFLAGESSAAKKTVGPGAESPIEEELGLLRSAWGPELTILYLSPFDPSSLAEADPLERRIEAAARELGLRYHGLREEFEDLARRRVAPYGFSNTRLNAGHLNAEGHAAAARILRREFLDLRAHGLL